MNGNATFSSWTFASPWTAIAIGVVFLVASGCSYDSSPLSEVECDPAFDDDLHRECVDGYWIEARDTADIPDAADVSDAGDACTAPTDDELCDDASAQCGEFETVDECGDERVLDCGTCPDDDICVDQQCIPPSCDDGIQSGEQTDIDCGGPHCPPCEHGLACSVEDDCLSEVCTEGICQPPSCDDGVHNGEQTDVDCGGPHCPPCSLGQRCDFSGDCESTACLNNHCVECYENDHCTGPDEICQDQQCVCADDRPDAEFCTEEQLQCGTTFVTDRCERTRSIGCGNCAGEFEFCNDNQCACHDNRSDSDFCDDHQLQCGTPTVDDGCGQPRTASCGSCSGEFEFCDGDHQCACDDDRSDSDFCADQQLQCGTPTVDDGCGQPRTASCGSCSGEFEFCDGDHQCACDDDRSDAALCDQYDLECANVVVDDGCGISRTISCGSCTGEFDHCNTSENKCYCDDQRSDEEICSDLADIQCDVAEVEDGCGHTRTVDCGGCQGFTHCEDNLCREYECNPDQTPFGAGSGTPSDPWKICSVDHLASIGDDPEYLDDHFLLVDDLFVDHDLPQIGTSEAAFDGVFDGHGGTIDGLGDDSGDDDLALFANVSESAEIRDLNLTGVALSGGARVAALAAHNHGTIRNVYAAGSIDGNGDNIGGLVAINDGTIESCSTSGAVTGTEDGEHGGSRNVGGLVGRNADSITTSHSQSAVSNQSWRTGGLVGRNTDQATIDESFATGSVTVTDEGTRVGGLVGEQIDEASITNSYATGSVEGHNAVGGLVGRTRHDTEIRTSYATGGDDDPNSSVTGNNFVGGLVGYSDASSPPVIASYWDLDKSDQSSSAGGSGRNTTQLGDVSTFDQRWIFETHDPEDFIWTMPSGGPPDLWWE